MTITASSTRLMNAIRPLLPGALDSQIQAVMFDIMDEFFQFTNVWQETIPVEAVVNQQEYDIAPVGVSDIVRLMYVWVHDDPQANADDNKVFRRPIAADMRIPGLLRIIMPVTSLPFDDFMFHAVVSLKCKDPADKDGFPIIPQWILDKYRRDFVDGIVGQLMAQPAKTYSNQTMAVYHKRRWRNAMTGCRIEVNRWNTYGAQAWRYPQQYRTTPRHGGGGYFGNWPV